MKKDSPLIKKLLQDAKQEAKKRKNKYAGRLLSGWYLQTTSIWCL